MTTETNIARVIHDVRFPRYADVMSGRRTIFHMPVDGVTWTVGDGLRIIAHPNLPRCKVGVLIDVRQVRLLDELDADVPKICPDGRAAYCASWDALYPELPSVGDPVVWRIEFSYGAWDAGDPPEWSIAS